MTDGIAGAPKRLDFSSFNTKSEADRGTVVHIDDPRTMEPLYHDAAEGEERKPVTITVLGEDSTNVRKHMKKVANKSFEKMRKRGELDLEYDTVQIERVHKCAVAVLEWDIFELDGKQLQCNFDNAVKLFGDDRFPWLMEQVEKAMKDRMRFFKSPARS